MPLAKIAAEFHARGIRTPRNGTWTPSAVRNLLARAV
ncbi:recombinase family protein [Roseomonas sp. GCM10028921]